MEFPQILRIAAATPTEGVRGGDVAAVAAVDVTADADDFLVREAVLGGDIAGEDGAAVARE